MRRAQLLNHVIIFAVGLIIIGLVFLFGYSIIDGFNEDRCNIQRVQFGTDLNQAIDRNKDWGTNRIVTLNPPCEVERVCFIDRTIVSTPEADPLPTNWEEGIQGQHEQRITNVLTGAVEASHQVPQGAQRDYTNVFTVSPEGDVLPVERYSTAAAAIKVEDNGGEPQAQCHDIAQTNRLEIRMRGDGTRARILSTEP